MSLPGKVKTMEWNRIEEKWFAMIVRLQAGAQGKSSSGPQARPIAPLIAPGQVAGAIYPKDDGKLARDDSSVRDDTNVRMTA